MIVVALVDSQQRVYGMVRASRFEPRKNGFKFSSGNRVGQRHEAVAVTDHDQEVGWRIILLGGAYLRQADLGRALIELCLLIDAPAQIERVELIAFGGTVGVER